MRFNEDSAPEKILFEGIIYRRMGGKKKYYLSQSTTNYGRKDPKGLHKAVWEFNSGTTVPAGHEIHHKDGDTFNFMPGNLECLPMGVHRRLPKNIDRDAVRENLSRIRPLAAAWHRSPEGRAWHSEHARNQTRQPYTGPRGEDRPTIGVRNCDWCGSEFEYRFRKSRICSKKCSNELCNYRKGLERNSPNPRFFVHPYYASRLQSDG